MIQKVHVNEHFVWSLFTFLRIMAYLLRIQLCQNVLLLCSALFINILANVQCIVYSKVGRKSVEMSQIADFVTILNS